MKEYAWLFQWAWVIIAPAAYWFLRRVEKVDDKAEKANKTAENAQKLSAETRVILAERHMTKPEVESLVDRTFRHLVDTQEEANKNIHSKLDDMSDDIKMLIQREMDDQKNGKG